MDEKRIRQIVREEIRFSKNTTRNDQAKTLQVLAESFRGFPYVPTPESLSLSEMVLPDSLAESIRAKRIGARSKPSARALVRRATSFLRECFLGKRSRS